MTWYDLFMQLMFRFHSQFYYISRGYPTKQRADGLDLLHTWGDQIPGRNLNSLIQRIQ